MSSISVNGEDVLCRVMQNDLLIETILNNLSVTRLDKVKCVCRRWYEIARNIIKNRTFYETFFIIIYPKGFKTSGNQKGKNECEIKVKKVFLNLVAESTGILEAENERSMVKHVDHYFSEQLSSFPDLGMIFTSSTSIIAKIDSKMYLPPTCKTVYICSKAGIIGQSSLTSKPLELEKYQFKVNGVTSCFIKKQWSDYKVIVTNWDEPQSLEPNTDDADYPVRCVLIFSQLFQENKRFNSWLDRNEEPVSIGGALVDKIFINGICPMITVTISGKNVKSASFVLDTRTAKEAHSKLTMFKNSLSFNADEKSSDIKTIGFIFICAGRGAAFYQGNINVESDLLHAIFPNVPFTGVFGNGEYGWDCYERPDCDQEFKSLSQANLARSFTSVIVLVQFKSSKYSST